MDKKTGLNNTKPGASQSRWSMPQPSSVKPEAYKGKSPAGGGGGAAANKHANTPGGTCGIPGSIKSRYN